MVLEFKFCKLAKLLEVIIEYSSNTQEGISKLIVSKSLPSTFRTNIKLADQWILRLENGEMFGLA